MKTSMITGALCLCSLSLFGQVGINTQSPAATLDVTSRTTGTATAVPEGLIAPRLTIADLNAKASAYGAAQTGSLIYVTDASNGSPSGQTATINAAGYYFFDGTNWLKVTTGNGGSSGSSNDIYTNDGTLSANRTIAMSDKTLAFSANPTTGTSHFTVDDTTLSVDALNNKVGIGTNTPAEKLHIENGNMFMHHDSPTLYFQSTIPNNTSNPNNNNGSIVFYEGQNSTTEGMYIRHVNNPTGHIGGNHLQLGSIENGIYNPVLKISNITKQILIDSPVYTTSFNIYPKLVINSNVPNTAIQIIDGTQGNNKVLTSDASGKASWKAGLLAAPSTTYTWNYPGPTGTLPYYEKYVYGPYTVGKTGWFMIQSNWSYIQSPSSGSDQGLGNVWMQINNFATNDMPSPNSSLIEQPINETILMNKNYSVFMLPSKMVYLTAGTNYYIHISTYAADTFGPQSFVLNYVQ